MDKVKRYAIYLLVIAGCGGLLFDFGGTIIGPALPYIGPADENPGSLGLFTTAQVSHLSSAVVMCAALACLAAGWLTEKFGRKMMMLVSAATAALACLPICLVEGNYPMFFLGRAMQGVAAGFIGVVVPMYLAECLDANSRGKGAGMFQLLDFIGITFCSIVGLVVVHTIGAADDATVTVAHSRTADLGTVTRQADVLVVAVGRESLITADMVKPGAVVIDVGMNRNAEGKLCGDVDFEGVKEVAGWITPVPGGVGPMTIAMLLKNTAECFENRLGNCNDII